MTYLSCSHWGLFIDPSDPGRLLRVAKAIAEAQTGMNHLQMAAAACAAYRKPVEVDPKHIKDEV